MRSLSEITPRQIRILEVLWRTGGSTTVEVQSALSADEDLARTTVATKLARMLQYGWVERSRVDRDFVYRAAVPRAQVRAAQVGRVVGALFSDDLPSFVSHALEAGDWDDDDLTRIEELLARFRAGERREEGT